MRLLQSVRPGSSDQVAASETQGLAGWVISMVRGWRGQRAAHHKQLQLVETLQLGGKRQLMLVRCAGECFLVGGGLESVETIVRLKTEAALGYAVERLDGSCS